MKSYARHKSLFGARFGKQFSLSRLKHILGQSISEGEAADGGKEEAAAGEPEKPSGSILGQPLCAKSQI